MIIEFARDDLIASRADCGKFFGSHFFGFKFRVRKSGGFFQNTESVCYFSRHGFDVNANLKILVAPLGLCRPKSVCGNFDFAHRIVFDTIIHNFFSRFIYQGF